jgi:hypothetical protein
MWLQKLDPIFNIVVDVMRPAFNCEPKYRVTMLTGKEWTRGPGTLPIVKGLVCYTEGSRTRGEQRPQSMCNLQDKGSVSL